MSTRQKLILLQYRASYEDSSGSKQQKYRTSQPPCFTNENVHVEALDFALWLMHVVKLLKSMISKPNTLARDLIMTLYYGTQMLKNIDVSARPKHVVKQQSNTSFRRRTSSILTSAGHETTCHVQTTISLSKLSTLQHGECVLQAPYRWKSSSYWLSTAIAVIFGDTRYIEATILLALSQDRLTPIAFLPL